MKKLLSFLLAMLMMSMCAVAGAETIELKVWGSQVDQALLAIRSARA